MNIVEFDDSLYYTGPQVTEALIASAERRLGRSLPASYLALLRGRNGGRPVRRGFPTDFPTSWAPDHFEITAIRGIGGAWGVDTPGPLSSDAMIEEWGYPPIGVVICDMPSGGHDAVMLDYREGDAEPRIAYIDEDRVPRVVASTFSDFVDGLEAVGEGDGPQDHGSER